ncbi:MAG: AMP-binding protein, partial [Bacteroidota bacterium]
MNRLGHVSPAISFPSDTCLHRLFEQQAQRNPDATALAFAGQSMSYAELNRQADRLAHHLIELGVQTEDFVVVYLERSFEMIVGIFGILKAGAAYVPIDVNYPKDRLAFMLEDAQAKVVLTQFSLIETLPPTSAKIVCLDQEFNQNLSVPTSVGKVLTGLPSPTQSPITHHQSPITLAYMIYTSGSTGKPKGCMISHENL